MSWFKNNVRQLITIIVISITCWLFFRFLYENNFKKLLPRIIGHLINSFWFCLVAFWGYLGFIKDEKKWKKKIWVIIHVIAFMFFIMAWVIEKVNNTIFINQWRDLFGYTRGFFTSPFPFLILWILPSVFQLSKPPNTYK